MECTMLVWILDLKKAESYKHCWGKWRTLNLDFILDSIIVSILKCWYLSMTAQQCSKQLVGWDGNEVPWQIRSSVIDILHPLIVCTTVAHSPPWFVEVMVLCVWRRIILVFGYKLTRAIHGSIWGEVLRLLQLSISSRGLSSHWWKECGKWYNNWWT